jgi:hypothetical protein
VIFVATKKGMTTYFFSPLSFVAVFGSKILDPGWTKIRPREKHPGSAMLVTRELSLANARGFPVFRIKTTIYLSPPVRTSKLQTKPSALKREHPALQNMNFLNFSIIVGHFCPPWIRIRIPNPDSDTDPLT